MDNRMTDEQRAKMKEFLSENPDAVATPVERVAVVDGYAALDKMRERFHQMCNNAPLAMLIRPELVAALTMYARCICELEVFLEQGVVTFSEDAIQERAMSMIRATLARITNTEEEYWNAN